MCGIRSRRLASDTSENAPVMSACEAMMAATVERPTGKRAQARGEHLVERVEVGNAHELGVGALS